MVTRVVLLDAGPLGLVTNPRQSPETLKSARWLQSLLSARIRVIVPEIADYEVRRELLRADKTQGIMRLDALISLTEFLPITTEAMRHAAQLWAQARQQGRPTAADLALDGDVILAAQAITLSATDTVIATTNVGHLSRFTRAQLWHEIDSFQ